MQSLLNTDASFINRFLKIPTRSFTPKNLYQLVFHGSNHFYYTADLPSLNASSISLSEKDAAITALGEYCERYSASYIDDRKLICGSFNQLQIDGRKLLHPDTIQFFTKEQYDAPGFVFKKLTTHDVIAWVEVIDYHTNENILMPAFMVYLGSTKLKPDDALYTISTSTGLAAHNNISDAINSGFLENVERDAFTHFWYNQEYIQFTKYAAATILEAFPNDTVVQQLFNNKRIRYNVFDLKEFCNVECIVVLLYFEFKDKLQFSIGCAARFTKREALIKAMMEAYQGIDFTIYMDSVDFPDFKSSEPNNFDFVSDFDKHFLFYTKYPEYMHQVPLLQQGLDFTSGYSTKLIEAKTALSSIKDLPAMKLLYPNMYYLDITTEDVKKLGYKVVRVITPDLALLTPHHKYPYIGKHAKTNENLFTRFPHPFP